MTLGFFTDIGRRACFVFHSLEIALYLFALENFNHVIGADVFVILKRHSAFLTRLDFFNFVLEPLERFQRTFVDHNIVTQQAHASGASRHTLSDEAPGDTPNP